MSEQQESPTNRGPKEYECMACETATYEKGECHNCGAKPYES